MPYLARSQILTGFAPLARSLGLVPERLARSVGLDLSSLNDLDARISAKAFTDLLQRSAALSKLEDFGLRLAESRELGILGPVGIVIRQETDLRSALNFARSISAGSQRIAAAAAGGRARHRGPDAGSALVRHRSAPCDRALAGHVLSHHAQARGFRLEAVARLLRAHRADQRRDASALLRLPRRVRARVQRHRVSLPAISMRRWRCRTRCWRVTRIAISIRSCSIRRPRRATRCASWSACGCRAETAAPTRWRTILAWTEEPCIVI